MVKGNLIYKCRMCGKIFKSVHVPDGYIALAAIINDESTPKSWGANVLSDKTICHCYMNKIGVADLIGFEKD